MLGSIYRPLINLKNHKTVNRHQEKEQLKNLEKIITVVLRSKLQTDKAYQETQSLL